jgi:hypothetical protein
VPFVPDTNGVFHGLFAFEPPVIAHAAQHRTTRSFAAFKFYVVSTQAIKLSMA